MTNTQIIANALIANGMTEDALEKLMQTTGDLPFHTVPEWARRGYHVKAGETPLFSCYLWKHTNKPSAATIKAAEDAGKDAPETSPHFYQKLSYIYAFNQVEKNAAAPDLATIKAALGNLDGVTLTVKGEKSGAPNVWLTGDTAQHAETIKAFGGVWSNKKGAYWIKPGTAPAQIAAAPEHKALPAPAPAADAHKAPAEPAPAPVPEAAPVQTAPGAWKKCIFYTIRREKGDDGATAHRAEGFTDGLFNYYSTGDKTKLWHAVHPVYGLSAASGSTRKAAQAEALKILDKIRAAEGKMNPRADKYAAMIKAAQDADNMTLF